MTQAVTSCHHPRNNTSAPHSYHRGVAKLDNRSGRIMRHQPSLGSGTSDAPRAPAGRGAATMEARNDPREEINNIPAILVVMTALLAAQELDDPVRTLTPHVGQYDQMVLPSNVVAEAGPLLRLGRRSTTPAALLRDAIDLLGGATGSRSTAQQREHNPLPEALSDREMRVLRYLPTHLSASEIANELYISLNTAKTHLRHIYTKLGVNSRKDAVEQARLLRLLAP
jgi:DNA-binding CsgD family transcriptional regulator